MWKGRLVKEELKVQAVYKELLNDTEFMYQFEKAYKKRKAQKRKNILYYAKQKLSGLALIAISIFIPLLFDGDATASVILLPLGIYLLFTRKKIMMFHNNELRKGEKP